ncbi:glucan biosynthesis protein [Mangrovicella endophytica]|uniref:glucan biosynthesis protein n=1 Tax=Mangrovicella endophytica TaxID=2066697 RepID=UPI000C9E3917|nr:glucan biosynthesis protein G [Mangrovicella endophytica]
MAQQAAAPQAPAPQPAAPAPAPAAEPAPFDFEALSAKMLQLSQQPFQLPESQLPEEVATLNYDEHRAIRFRPDHAQWLNDPVNFQLQAFYPGWVFKDTTQIFIGDGKTFEPKVFSSSDFEYRPPLDPSRFQPINLSGVAGFRLHAALDRPDYFDELVTFLGASYFRALGMGTRYGLSARGLAINTATGSPEEFPRFTAFYVTRPQPGETTLRLMAELDSESLTGAYAFTITPGPQTVMDVTTRLYFRKAVDRLGVAPLTSMYYFGENAEGHDDFRPEVHDSDGLAIHRQNGDRLWRPLNNPEKLSMSYFQESSPSAFGLLQRDRTFSHYEDVEARYDLRPSLMIEPLGDWGRGSIELVEIPTPSEVNDNIVAFWVPDEKPDAGSAYEFRYRMRWGLDVQAPDGLARVGGSFVGVGGNAADLDKGTPTTRRFAINFIGGTARNLPIGTPIDPVVDVSANAKIIHVGVDRLPDNGWRLSLELEKLDSEPVELRAKLSMLQRIISETWLYQWTGAV